MEKNKLIPVIEDEDFIRGNVPMTKSSIRHLSIIRLGLSKGDVLYDIGSGTGSIAVQASLLDQDLRVYAIEMKQDALNLIKQNKDKFFADNVTIVEGEAPGSLKELEKPTHAFIGGSGGNLMGILDELKNKNPKARVVINAISLETISEVTGALKEYQVRDLNIEQVAVSRGREIGNYHMLMAENPIMIVSFNFDE